MEIKNLFDPAVKQEIIARIQQLTPSTPRQWGKMDVAQMLAHIQAPMGVALGVHSLKANFLMRLIFPLFKKKLYDESPWKQGLPTDKTFITTGDARDFEKEKAIVLDMLQRFTPENIKSDRHPIFGKLTKENWSKATWKHMDHHLRQFGV